MYRALTEDVADLARILGSRRFMMKINKKCRKSSIQTSDFLDVVADKGQMIVSTNKEVRNVAKNAISQPDRDNQLGYICDFLKGRCRCPRYNISS